MKANNVLKTIGAVTVGCIAADVITGGVKMVCGLIAAHKATKELDKMMGEDVFTETEE